MRQGDSTETWLVAVYVDDFDPNHDLWPAFVEEAEPRAEPAGFQWTLTLPSDTSGGVRVRAIVEDPSAEHAVERVMAVVRAVGRSIDHDHRVPWEGMRGVADHP